MNSVLQCLFHEPQLMKVFASPDFRKRFIDIPPDGTKGLNVSRCTSNTIHSNSISIVQAQALTIEFEKLFRDYWSVKFHEIEPREFKSRLGQICQQFDNFMQQDG